MPILEVRKENSRQLHNIADTIASAKKIVVVTGAGISTNCGIPDFRSQAGLYSIIQAQRHAASSPKKDTSFSTKAHANAALLNQKLPNSIKGKDLFDSQIWKDPVSTSVFFTFIASLRKKIREDVKRTSTTHHFIKTLRDRGKLVRCYTQNIDGLESRGGLCTDMSRGKGNRSRFTKQSLNKPKAMARTLLGGNLDGGCEVVQLHGDLEVLRCSLCQQTCSWDDRANVRLMVGKAPLCHFCTVTNQDRQDRGKRGTKIGTLRPNIVLYGEEHPSAEIIGTITAHDLALSPDVLLILGTSLHVHGLKLIVKEFAKSVHARAGGRGKVIFVNLTKPPDSVWKEYIDYWISMDCDDWVEITRRFRKDIWHIQEELKPLIKKSSGTIPLTPCKIPSSMVKNSGVKAFEDKENIPTSLDLLKASTPRVILTPKKPRPLGDRNSSVHSRFLESSKISKGPPNEQDQRDSQLQLPTPPTTDHRVKFQTSPTPSRKRGLTEIYQEHFNSPSKRKKGEIIICEDSEPD